MTSTVDEPTSRSMRSAFRLFSAIERIGNKLPHPFWLFWILAGVVVVLSAVLAGVGVSAVQPGSGDTIAVRSLLSQEGFDVMVGGAVESFALFPPLATIVTVMLGIAVAERSELVTTLLRRMVSRVPGKYLTFVLSMTAMVGHVAGDAAYVTLIPLGALVFRAAGRSPVLGAVVAFVSISAGYDASPSLTTTDVLLSGISTAAAQTIDESYVVTPVSNYFFSLASSVLIAVVITVVTEKVLARRPDLEPDAEPTTDVDEHAGLLHVDDRQRRALRLAGAAGAAYVVVLVLAVLPNGSWLRGADGAVLESPLLTGLALVLGLFFAIVGTVYGFAAGTFTRAQDVVTSMVEGVKALAPILVLFFAISQFLAYFKWTYLGEILAITGAEALREVSAPGWAILLGIAVLVTFMNLVITSGSALWSLAAPVFVPMLMLLDINPETTQAIYRVADSVTNCVTPMSPYFVMALGFIQQHRRSAGIGTLASFTIPLAAVIWVVWVAFFLAWYLLGIPLGPGAPVGSL
ncbi:AbgT family transporter [Nocardioides marmoraquaticus]